MPDNAPRRSDQKPKKKKRRIRLNPFRTAIVLVCAIVAVTCCVMLVNYLVDYFHSTQVSQELKEVYTQAKEIEMAEKPTSTPSAEVNDAALPLSMQSQPLSTPAAARTAPNAYTGNERFKARPTVVKLQERSRDIIGWLSIPDVLDDPVVQRDNTYYLTHDYMGNHSATGALFLDESCKLYPVPECLLLHGHNMKTGAMFGALKKYKVSGTSFFRDHGYIRFETLYEDATYVVFSVAQIDIRPSQSAFLNFMGSLSFSTDNDFMRYIGKLKTLSLYEIGVDVLPSDRILILSTCDGTDENLRLLVAARMLRKDEDLQPITDALRSVKQRRTF